MQPASCAAATIMTVVHAQAGTRSAMRQAEHRGWLTYVRRCDCHTSDRQLRGALRECSTTAERDLRRADGSELVQHLTLTDASAPAEARPDRLAFGGVCRREVSRRRSCRRTPSVALMWLQADRTRYPAGSFDVLRRRSLRSNSFDPGSESSRPRSLLGARRTWTSNVVTLFQAERLDDELAGSRTARLFPHLATCMTISLIYMTIMYIHGPASSRSGNFQPTLH